MNLTMAHCYHFLRSLHPYLRGAFQPWLEPDEEAEEQSHG